LQHAPIDFPVLFPIAVFNFLFQNPAEERKKETKKTQIRIHSAIQTTAEIFFWKLQLFPSRKPLLHTLETSR
jgi:hypothetical protein